MANTKWSAASAATGILNTDKVLLLQDPSGTPTSGTATLATLGIQKAEIPLVVQTGNISTGNGKTYWMVPTAYTGWNLTGVAGGLGTVSSSGAVTIQVHNLTDTTDMLSTALTIDANEPTSYTAATAAVIDTGADDLLTGDIIQIDIDGAGTGAANLVVNLTIEKNA